MELFLLMGLMASILSVGVIGAACNGRNVLPAQASALKGIKAKDATNPQINCIDLPPKIWSRNKVTKTLKWADKWGSYATQRTYS
jgi:hypothetical protein